MALTLNELIRIRKKLDIISSKLKDLNTKSIKRNIISSKFKDLNIELIEKNINDIYNLIDRKIIKYHWKHLAKRDLYNLAIRAYLEQNNNHTVDDANKAYNDFKNLIDTNKCD